MHLLKLNTTCASGRVSNSWFSKLSSEQVLNNINQLLGLLLILKKKHLYAD